MYFALFGAGVEPVGGGEKGRRLPSGVDDGGGRALVYTEVVGDFIFQS